MALVTMLSQTSLTGPSPSFSFASSDPIRTLQFLPQTNGVGFTGAVAVQVSYAVQPGASDWNEIATVDFIGHMSNLTVNLQSDAPRMRVVITGSQLGSIAVNGNSGPGPLGGSIGTVSGGATAIVRAAVKAAGVGTNFYVEAQTVPGLTTDDIVNASNLAQTLSQFLATKQDIIGTGVITANQNDVNLLTGVAAYGLTTADLQKLADTNASTAELNRLVGVTSNVQTQITTLAGQINGNLTGVTATSAAINAFFGATTTGPTWAELAAFDGLTASSADLNVFTGTAATFTALDMAKLGAITASAADINRIGGFTGSSSDLNKISGFTGSSADLSAIAGLAATGVTATQLQYLSGLTENVQSTLNSIPELSGLTASAADLNTLAGIFAGTGAYPAQISATELSYLNGVSSNIQTQLNGKRSSASTIGIAEITGSSISITELNYLQGATSNLQTQLNTLNSTKIGASGGTFTGAIRIANGTAGAPTLTLTTPTTSGWYKFSTAGWALSISGTRFASFDGTALVLGDGTVNGSPTLRGAAGFGVTDPVYSFTNDSDTGVYWAGANAIGISAGAEAMIVADATNNIITMGGTVSNNNAVRVTGVFEGEKLLGRATVAAGSVTGATGNTTLYTVPTGRTAIITRVYVVLNTVTNFTSGSLLRMNIGFGGSSNEIVDNTTNTTIFNPVYGFNTAGQVMPLGVGDNTFPAISGTAGAAYQFLAAGTILRANVAALAGADAFDMTVLVFGVEY